MGGEYRSVFSSLLNILLTLLYPSLLLAATPIIQASATFYVASYKTLSILLHNVNSKIA